MENKDYCEILCTAIDEIVTTRLQGLSYDITKLCTIVDDSQARQGKYVVSDGAARFEAYTNDITFKNGNSVLVTIPNGDYNMQKSIVGRVAAADTTPFKYTSPMDTMIKITNNVFDGWENEIGLLANEDNGSTRTDSLYSSENSQGFAGFTRLGITADFRSWLNGLDVTTGQYGLRVQLLTEALISSGGETKEQIYELTFSSSDMVGNPYQFESYFSQEKVFDISSIGTIKRIDVFFYQNGQFYDGNDNYIEWQTQIGELEPEKLSNNLFVDNVKIYLGYEQGRFTDETLMLYSSDKLSYHYYNKDEIKNVYLRWIHKIDEYNYELLDGTYLSSQYEARWFKLQPGYQGEYDAYAGQDWERIYPIGDDVFHIQFTPDVQKQSEQIKVVGLIRNAEGGIQAYSSNLLIFENEEKVPSQLDVDVTQALSIHCLDNSEGNYFLYDQNGKIINEAEGASYSRSFEALYYGTPINQSLGKIDWLKWWIPTENIIADSVDKARKIGYTMLIDRATLGEPDETNVKLRGVDYNIYKINGDNLDVAGNLLTDIGYSIKDYYSVSNANNIIRCVLSINNTEYIAEKELRFGILGSNGTNSTFVINFANNKEALNAIANDTIEIVPHLYDATGNRIDFTAAEAKQIEWDWFHSLSEIPNYMAIAQKRENGNCLIKFTGTAGNVPQDNYHILKASFNGLEAYLPIPIRLDNSYTYFEGSKSVIYDHRGIPKYYPHEYIVHKYENGVLTEVGNNAWKLVYPDTVDIVDYLPKLKDSTFKKGYKALSAASFYVADYSDQVCVSNGYWSQPILIMQGRYDFAMLNAWNGDLTIDEKNGIMLSTMVGAGRKNPPDDDKGPNTFSGVLMGDISSGTDLESTEKMTGVYGFDHGVISYALREDGTATFGAGGNGQILIDGSGGTIQSANFNDGNGNGMGINLNLGKIHIKKDKAEILLQPDEPYAEFTSFNGNKLLHMGSEKYFLQSDNYTVSSGTKLDLINGNFTVQSPYGQVSISGGYDADNKQIPYFQIAVPTGGGPDYSGAYDNALFKLTDDEYYLQSSNYNSQNFITVQGYNTYTNSSGNTIAVTNDRRIYYVDGSNLGSEITFTDTTETKRNEDGTTTTVVIESAETKKNNYLAGLTPRYQGGNRPRGFKMDLKNSMLHGYDLALIGTKSTDTSKTFRLDSTASTYPFQIGSDFTVAWDGTLNCNKVNSLNNDGNSQYPISLNNNFYVDSSGNISGNGFSGNSGSFGSVSGGSGSFGSVKGGTGTFDNLVVGGKKVNWCSKTVMTEMHSISLGHARVIKDGLTVTPSYTFITSGLEDVTGYTVVNGVTTNYNTVSAVISMTFNYYTGMVTYLGELTTNTTLNHMSGSLV